jgi:hypothetical protein
VQRLVHALARQPDEVAQLLLGDPQQVADAGVQRRVEQRREAARHAGVGVVQAVDLARRDELAEPLVELHRDEAVERDAAVEQPVEGVGADPGDGAAPQSLDVVAVVLALEHRAFAEPAARRHAGEGDRHAERAVVAHLQQPVDEAEPVRHRAPDAADVVAGLHVDDAQIGDDPLALDVVEAGQPRYLRPLGSVGRARVGGAHPAPRFEGVTLAVHRRSCLGPRTARRLEVAVGTEPGSGISETPVGANPRIVVGTTTRRQSRRQNAAAWKRRFRA